MRSMKQNEITEQNENTEIKEPYEKLKELKTK
jgi:hypothetical protein